MPSMSTVRASSVPLQAETSRWAQLVFGVACMVAASNIQYSWTQFVPEIQKAHGWERAAIQTAFSIFVVVQTWCTPFVGALIDRLGPRALVLFGGVLTGLAWVINSYATSLPGFYVGSVVGGLGVGAVYSTCINNAIKWFPDRRGLAVGLTAAGVWWGTNPTDVTPSRMIFRSRYQSTFFTFGVIQGLVILVFASFLRAPAPGAITYSAS